MKTLPKCIKEHVFLNKVKLSQWLREVGAQLITWSVIPSKTGLLYAASEFIPFEYYSCVVSTSQEKHSPIETIVCTERGIVSC